MASLPKNIGIVSDKTKTAANRSNTGFVRDGKIWSDATHFSADQLKSDRLLDSFQPLNPQLRRTKVAMHDLRW